MAATIGISGVDEGRGRCWWWWWWAGKVCWWRWSRLRMRSALLDYIINREIFFFKVQNFIRKLKDAHSESVWYIFIQHLPQSL